MTFSPCSTTFSPWAEVCMYWWDSIFSHVCFQWNNTKPKVTAKSGSYPQVLEQAPMNLKQYEGAHSGRLPHQRRSPAQKKTSPLEGPRQKMGTYEHIPVHDTSSAGAENALPAPLQWKLDRSNLTAWSLWSLAVTWAVLGYFLLMACGS